MSVVAFTSITIGVRSVNLTKLLHPCSMVPMFSQNLPFLQRVLIIERISNTYALCLPTFSACLSEFSAGYFLHTMFACLFVCQRSSKYLVLQNYRRRYARTGQ